MSEPSQTLRRQITRRLERARPQGPFVDEGCPDTRIAVCFCGRSCHAGVCGRCGYTTERWRMMFWMLYQGEAMRYRHRGRG